MNVMVLQLSYTHKEIINLNQGIKSPKELEEIKSLLIAYFSDKVTREANKSFLDKNILMMFSKSGKRITFAKEHK